MPDTIDLIIHAPLRLAIMNLLVNNSEAEFAELKSKTNASAGNLSAQIKKLNDAGYISIVKQFKNNYPQTLCKITAKGIKAFENYAEVLKIYIQKNIPG